VARRRLTPSPLPEDPPAHLGQLRRAAVVAVEREKEAEAAVQVKRHAADQATERYEAALLEYVGQLTLFEQEERDG
jgi:hypothetical protein